MKSMNMDLDLRHRKPSEPVDKLGPLQIAEKDMMLRAFKANGGHLANTADVLRLSIITTRKRAKQYGLWPWKG